MQNGIASRDGDSAETTEGEMPERPLIVYETPQPPSLVATSPHQMTLQWKELQLKHASQDWQLEGLAVEFALLMKLVGLLYSSLKS